MEVVVCSEREEAGLAAAPVALRRLAGLVALDKRRRRHFASEASSETLSGACRAERLVAPLVCRADGHMHV